jgi:membrane dipeptidase
MKDSGKMTIYERKWQAGLAALNPSQKDLEHGLELHKNSFVFDAYSFMPRAAGYCARIDQLIDEHASRDELRYAYEEFGMCSGFKDAENQKKLREIWDMSGVDCVFQNCGEESNDIETLIKRLSSYTGVIDRVDSVYERAAFPEQLAGIRERGKKALYITTNGVPIPSKLISSHEALMYLQVFFNFGVRMMHMTYNRRNLIGDGCAELSDGGLSAFGKDVVKEMNRVGIIPDVAHSGQRTSLETALCSEKPVVASHSVAGKFSTHYRAKGDDVIAAIKKTNGYIGICAYPKFIQLEKNLKSFIDHIDYVAKTFGVDHVAIGTDTGSAVGEVTFNNKFPANRSIYEQFWTPPGANVDATEEQWDSLAWTNWPLYTVGLVQRGYSDEEIQKIIGGNVLRVCRDTLA